jgi:uncharacterized protein (DUF1697 family)
MSEYAAFLRGMNVGGHRISNGELGRCFEELGFRDVGTFRASGNVIFAADAATADLDPSDTPLVEMTARIEAGLEASLGYAVPVFLRTASEVRQIAAHQPFLTPTIEASKGKPQVVMLSAKPAAQARKAVLALASEEDDLAFGDRELHWLPSGGILDSALDFKLIGQLLGPMTTRTKGTIEQVAAKYFPNG